MPTLWKWEFVGSAVSTGRNGEQRAFSGDNVVVVDPDISTCVLERIEGAGATATMIVKHGSGETCVIRNVAAANVYAVASRPERLDQRGAAGVE